MPAAALALIACLRIAGLFLVGDPWSTEWEHRIFYSDTYSYLHAADELADGSQNMPLFRVPGYPLLLLGTRDLCGPAWTATMIIHQIADLLTALVVVAVSTPLLGKVRGIWSGAFYLALPSGILYSSFMIPDILVACLIALSGLLWLRTPPGASPARGALNGLLGGLCFSSALLLKPVVLYAPLIYLALVFIPKNRGRLARALFAVMLALPSTGTYLILRNHNERSFGLPGISTQDALEPMGRMVQIADYRGTGVGGETFWTFEDSLSNEALRDGVVDWGRRDSLFRAVTREAVLSNPLRVAYFELTRWPKFFVNLDGHQPYLGITPRNAKPLWYVALTSMIQFPLGIALLAALAVPGIRRRLGRVFWLGLAWFLYCVPVIGPIASFRYGLMFYWALVPFLFVACDELTRGKGSRQGATEPGRDLRASSTAAMQSDEMAAAAKTGKKVRP